MSKTMPFSCMLSPPSRCCPEHLLPSGAKWCRLRVCPGVLPILTMHTGDVTGTITVPRSLRPAIRSIRDHELVLQMFIYLM